VIAWPSGIALATLAAVSLAALPSQAQTGDGLEAAVEQALAEEGLVGATWALVRPEEAAIGAAGLNDASRSLRMKAGDRVQVASVAKTLIAAGILRLVTDGRVDLDAPVARYLPDVPFENPWQESAPLRVRHLLDHSGGLDDVRMWQVFSLKARPEAPLREGLPHDGNALRIRHRPGERFSYSNTGYLLLGMLIEAVTESRYEAWLDAALLAPLGMTQSTFEFVSQAGPHADSTLAMGHFDSSMTSATVASYVRPATQFTTTAADMARFARFLMSDGLVEGRVLIDATLLRAMGTPTRTEAARAGLAAGYAFGLARRDRHGAVGKCHLGNQGNFRAALCLFPEQQRAFFVAYNADPEDADFDRIDGMLVRALGVRSSPQMPAQPPGLDPALWQGLYRVRPSRFQQFAYLDEVMGVIRVAWDGRELHLHPLTGPPRELTPLGGALFRAPERREASHVLLRAADESFVIADGLRTLERVQPSSVYSLWASAAAGVAALIYLLIAGGARSLRALRRRAWRAEPLRWPTICLVLMLMAPALYLGQSFLAIGDPTPANVALALLTAALPITLLIAAAQRLRAGTCSWIAGLDLFALAAALQLCVVLASWGMLPLVLWR
jgi:CubicO group peptidase (beta-lactamase class C family)